MKISIKYPLYNRGVFLQRIELIKRKLTKVKTL